MSKTERLLMVQCTSCSKEIQLSVFENHRWQCAPTQRLSKITGDFPIVSEKSSFFTSLQEIFPDKPFLKFCWHTISTKINPRKSFFPKISKKLLLNLFRKRRILLLFLPDSSGQQHSFVLEWMCLTEFELCHFYNFFWILSFEYFCRVLFVVCVLFTSKFAGSRKGLMHSLMWLSLFFLVFSFFSLQLINRRTLEIRVDFSSPAIKN